MKSWMNLKCKLTGNVDADYVLRRTAKVSSTDLNQRSSIQWAGEGREVVNPEAQADIRIGTLAYFVPSCLQHTRVRPEEE